MMPGLFEMVGVGIFFLAAALFFIRTIRKAAAVRDEKIENYSKAFEEFRTKAAETHNFRYLKHLYRQVYLLKKNHPRNREFRQACHDTMVFILQKMDELPEAHKKATDTSSRKPRRL